MVEQISRPPITHLRDRLPVNIMSIDAQAYGEITTLIHKFLVQPCSFVHKYYSFHSGFSSAVQHCIDCGEADVFASLFADDGVCEIVKTSAKLSGTNAHNIVYYFPLFLCFSTF